MTWVALITGASTAVLAAAGLVTSYLAWRAGHRAGIVAVRGFTYRLQDGRTITRRPHYRRVAYYRPWWRFAVSPQRLTRLAMLIAGRQRTDVCCEWRSHLAGETGAGLPEGRQVREAAGFVLAAIQYRVQDIVGFAWKPVDTVLASRALSNLFVLLATLLVVMVHVHHGGLYELADNLEGVGVVWGAAFGLIHIGRQWRDVKPPERKPRRTKE